MNIRIYNIGNHAVYHIFSPKKREKLLLLDNGSDPKTLIREEAFFQDDARQENLKFNGYSFKKRMHRQIKHEDKRWQHVEDHQVIFDIYKNDTLVNSFEFNPETLNQIMNNIDVIIKV